MLSWFKMRWTRVRNARLRLHCHDEVQDEAFNEFNLIIAPRSLPDFGPLLHQRVHQLFHESLAPLGYVQNCTT